MPTEAKDLLKELAGKPRFPISNELVGIYTDKVYMARLALLLFYQVAKNKGKSILLTSTTASALLGCRRGTTTRQLLSEILDNTPFLFFGKPEELTKIWPDLTMTTMPALMSATYNEAKKTLEVFPNDALYDWVKRIEKNFLYIDLKGALRLSRTRAVNLYLHLSRISRFNSPSHRRLSLAELFVILGLPEKRTTSFLLRELKEALHEVVTKTDLVVSLALVRDGRKAVAVEFSFGQKRQAKH